jgi:putative tryptophan/tyrosine transport system substrate-binding protein
MRRREFIAGLGGSVAWRVVARPQQSAMQVIGFLSSGAREGFTNFVTYFRQGLEAAGFAEGG